MFTTVTTRQYLESNFEKTDKHLTRFKQDEKRLTALIQSLRTQLPWETLKKFKLLLKDLCKKYASNYTVGITACQSYYEKHGKLTAANHQGKFVNHKLIVWNAALEPEWREACHNMINVLLEKNNGQLPPLIFTITALKNLIVHYKLYDDRGKLVENYQTVFDIIDETLNTPIPESFGSQFIQNKIDSSKPVNRQQPTDRSDLLNLRKNTNTIGEWVENVKSKYDITKQMVYYYFKKFDINPKEEIKKPFEDLRTQLDEALARIRELEMTVFKLENYKTECETLRKKCDDIKNDACEKIRAYNTNVENFKAELQHKFDEAMEKLKDAQSQTPTTTEEMVSRTDYDALLKELQDLKNKMQESPVDGDMVSKADYDEVVNDRDYYKNQCEDKDKKIQALNEQHNKDVKENSDLQTTLSNKPIDMPTTGTNNMQLGIVKPTISTGVNNIQGLEGWMPNMSIG